MDSICSPYAAVLFYDIAFVKNGCLCASGGYGTAVIMEEAS